MMNHQLDEFLKLYGPKMEDALLRRLPLSDKPGTELFNQAVYYAVFPSGKRMRPLFTLLATKTVGGDPEQAIPIACAIEYFHTCSLIFDDLPAMDNALERRRRQPTHQVFGEDVAMLAALAFLNQGYALTGEVSFSQEQNNRRHCLMNEMTTCIGPNGMIGGQMVDLRLGRNVSERLRPISYLKTTSLMRLMLTAGAIVGGADETRADVLGAFGEHLGEAYQMLDDIVDKFEDYPSATMHHAGVDTHCLWKEANENLKKAHDRLNKDLAECNPTLLIELTQKIFSKLKKQAAGLLVDKKWHYESVSQDGIFLQPE